MDSPLSKTDLMFNLDKWQAASHPILSDQKPEALFESPFVDRYRRLHRDLWLRICRLHGTLSTLEQLRQFPFEILHSLDQIEFWRLVYQNFTDVVVLMLHGLVNDSGSDANTLHSLKNEIVRATWLSIQMKTYFTETLRERKFDKEIRAIADKVDWIRDNRVAHPLGVRTANASPELTSSIKLEEMRQLFDACHKVFGAVSFGASYCTLPGDLMPTTVGGKPTPTCLDQILDSVIRCSDVVHGPERRAEWWPTERAAQSPETIRKINLMRKRIGLPEV